MESKEEILSSLHITLEGKEYTYKDIFANYGSTNFGNCLINLEPLGRYFYLTENNYDYYFYVNPIVLNIQKDNSTVSHRNIYSYEQIKTLIDEKDLNNAYINTDNQCMRMSSLNITKLINKNIYDFKVEIRPLIDINNKPFLIAKDKGFKPEELTSKFYQYFKYNNQSEKNNFFNFVVTKERENLFACINTIINDNNVYQFKLTGPSSNGKSTSILYFSRTRTNTFYFNLSYLSKCESEDDHDSIFNTISEEMKRLYFPIDCNKNEIYQLLEEQKGKKTWEIISFLINHLNKNTNRRYIFIFDQFKPPNVDKAIYRSLLDKIKNSNIKFIICSSINDLKIKKAFKKTIIKFNGNPNDLDRNTQDYYFYFIFLYIPTYKKQDKYYLILKLFGFLQKYQYTFKNCKNEDLEDEIIKIDNRIEEKLKLFESSSKLINTNVINFYDSLMTVIQNINKDIDYEKLEWFYDILPLKYFYFEFKPQCFRIHYLFEYIIIYINKKINNDTFKTFFKKGGWSNTDIKSNIKGQYFEKSVINSIKNNKIKFEKKYEFAIKLNEICSMDYEVKDKLSEALKRIMQNDNSEIIDDNSSNDNIEEPEKNEINDSNVIIKEPKIEEKPGEDSKLMNEEEINTKKESNKPSDILSRRAEKIDKIVDKSYENNSRDLPEFLSEDLYKDNLLDINDFKKMLGSFEKIDDKKRKRIKNYDNNSILIEQDKINGRCIDMAMIWTNKDGKNIFIGFQMKCFREDTKGGNASKITKMNIKCHYLDILIYSEELLGITIDEWHYIMILFCSHTNEEKNDVSQYLIKKCIKNRIKYIFYDPVEELFYDKDLKVINGVFTLLDLNSNLDYGNNFSVSDKLNGDPGEYLLGKKRQLSSGNIIKENNKDLSDFKEFLKKYKISLHKFRKDIMNEFKDIDKIVFAAKIPTHKLESFLPTTGNMICYRGKKGEILLAIKRDDINGIEYFNLTKKTYYEEYRDFLFDTEDDKYFYILSFQKRIN